MVRVAVDLSVTHNKKLRREDNMDNETLSDEQIEIWLEVLEARQGGLPNDELRAIFQSHTNLRTRVRDLEKILGNLARAADVASYHLQEGNPPGMSITTIRIEYQELRRRIAEALLLLSDDIEDGRR